MKELVLYYTPHPQPHTAKLKGVLVRMGVRIRNVALEQTGQTVGFLAGVPGFEAQNEEEQEMRSHIPQEMLVMKNFTSGRIDQLLMELRKAGVPRIALKAIVTESNCPWTFYQLYEELCKEHEAMSGQKGR